jgi:hypothetical protein
MKILSLVHFLPPFGLLKTWLGDAAKVKMFTFIGFALTTCCQKLKIFGFSVQPSRRPKKRPV